jgi:peptidoglycan hydrolase-like protein with peptidoglycan-binding domain
MNMPFSRFHISPVRKTAMRPSPSVAQHRAALPRRIVTSLLAAVLAGVAFVGIAPAASAATLPCGQGLEVTIGASASEMYSVLRPANYDGSDTCYMNQGWQDFLSGPVTALQLSLNYCYGMGLVVDGKFGPATAAALRSVQSVEGIPADGIYGPQTRDNMKWRVTDHTWCWQKY